MKLYEITDQIRALRLEDIEPEAIADTLESLELEAMDKCRNVAAYFQNLEVDSKALKEAEDRIKSRRLTLEKQIESLKEYLRINMDQCGITKISTPEFSVTRGKPSEVLEVYDPKIVDQDFVTKETVYKVDKVGLKKWMKEKGLTEVEGAAIVAGKSRLIIK